jgi:folate-binding Fe-S cluster repair protein YgfZ
LLPVEIDGPLPAPGTPIMLGSEAAGEIHSGRDGHALALLRLEAVEAAKSGALLTAGDAQLTPVKPTWAKY